MGGGDDGGPPGPRGPRAGSRPHRRDDLRLDIADRPRLPHRNTELPEPPRDIARIRVLGSPGQNLIPDDEHSYSVKDEEVEKFLKLVQKRKQI